MNSEEALKELCSRCYVESDLCSCHPRYSGGKVNNTCSLKDAILQDLDQLEKYKKAIEILKNNLGVAPYHNKAFNTYTIDVLNYHYKLNLSKQEYELLKEVLECN